MDNPLVIRFAYDKASAWPPGHGYDARPLLALIRGIVIHSTEHEPGQSFAAVCTFLRDSPDVSAHYVIDSDGTIQRVLDPCWRAWHAGVSAWQGQAEGNDWTIGIELYHRAGGPPYPAAQRAACAALMRRLMAERPSITRPNLVAHRWIALPAGRKQDPTDWPDPILRTWLAAL